MELYHFFKSIVDQDKSAVVICNTEHIIIYMNEAAVKRYEKRGGSKLVGQSLLDCHAPRSNDRIREVTKWFQESSEHNRVYTSYHEKENMDIYMVALRNENGDFIGYYEKHEYRDKENAKLYDFQA